MLMFDLEKKKKKKKKQVSVKKLSQDTSEQKAHFTEQLSLECTI